MLDGGLSTYTAMHLYTYVPIWLYAYVSTTSTLGGDFVFLVAGLPMRWMFPYVGVFVWGGDGALARTRVVAPGCTGDGAVVWLGSSTHTPGVPTYPPLVICAALCRLRRCVG